MLSTTRAPAIAVAVAILAAAAACGGAVATDPFRSGDSGDPSPDAAAQPIAYGIPDPDVPAPADAGAPALIDAGKDSASLLAPLPCEQRAAPAMCAPGDPPYYSATSLEAAWTDCGGTSGVQRGCGVLTVAFDKSGCASVAFSAAPGDAGAAACLKAALGAYRFECSEGSGIALNHLCN